MTLEEKIKDRLHEGQIIKNKQELFRILELGDSNRTIKGKQKQLLERKLSAYMNWQKKIGNSIQINEIYVKPLKLIDGRKHKRHKTEETLGESL